LASWGTSFYFYCNFRWLEFNNFIECVDISSRVEVNIQVFWGRFAQITEKIWASLIINILWGPNSANVFTWMLS